MPKLRALVPVFAAAALSSLLLAPHAASLTADPRPPAQPPGVPFGLCQVVDPVASSQQHPCPDQDPDGKGDDGDGDGPVGL